MSSFIAGISLVCFGASYALAWLWEAAELALRKGARPLWVVVFVLAGFAAQTLYLGHRAVELSATLLSSSFDWCLVASWLVVAAYLYLTYYHPRAALGLYLLPLALALIIGAAFADRTPFDATPAARAWGVIHGVALLAGTLAVAVGFAAGLMYLSQAYRLKHKLPPMPGVNVPSLEWLERINSRSLLISALMIGIGFFAGIILNVVGREGQGELPWSDPVIWSSAAMLAWLLAASAFNAVYRPARRGRKVAYLTVASFGFLVMALAVLLLVDTRHGSADSREATAPLEVSLSAVERAGGQR